MSDETRQKVHGWEPKSTATIRPGESTEASRSVVNKLDEADKAIIQDCIKKKLSADTTFLTVTDMRLSNNKPRITKPAVEEYFNAVTAVGAVYPSCPFTGLSAKKIIEVEISGENAGILAVFRIPVEEEFSKTKIQVEAKLASMEDVDMAKRAVRPGLPLMTDSYIGKKQG